MRISAPRKPKGWGIVWFLLLLCVLTVFNPKFHEAFSPDSPGSRWVLSLYFGGIVLIGIWKTAARDVIFINPPSLALRHEIFGLGITRHYPLDQLSNLQFRHQVRQPRESIPSCLTFDYQYLPRRCADDIAENEAAELLPMIKAQFPDLVARSATSSAHEFDDPQPISQT
jgi:hypothetical protein